MGNNTENLTNEQTKSHCKYQELFKKDVSAAFNFSDTMSPCCRGKDNQ